MSETCQNLLVSEETITTIHLRGQARTIRRKHLGRNRPKCPTCGTKQVQLISYIGVPAEWKCRHCTTKFIYEPEEIT